MLHPGVTSPQHSNAFPWSNLLSSAVGWQGAAAAERSALEAQVESLLKLAHAHEGGKASYARSIVEELFCDFLDVEERFAADEEATEQEVIDSMRRVSALVPANPRAETYSI